MKEKISVVLETVSSVSTKVSAMNVPSVRRREALRREISITVATTPIQMKKAGIEIVNSPEKVRARLAPIRAFKTGDGVSIKRMVFSNAALTISDPEANKRRKFDLVDRQTKGRSSRGFRAPYLLKTILPKERKKTLGTGFQNVFPLYSTRRRILRRHAPIIPNLRFSALYAVEPEKSPYQRRKVVP